MPICAVFTSTVGAQEKTKQNKKQAKSSSYFTRMAEQRAFWQRNRHRAWAWPLLQHS